ncbi:hypothetical protein AAEX28_05605 [Lentisphaerota bacterium WC36G]|nr:hypothetical protein LJT99_08465 [Lentisphaerae bacterium WC36]
MNKAIKNKGLQGSRIIKNNDSQIKLSDETIIIGSNLEMENESLEPTPQQNYELIDNEPSSLNEDNEPTIIIDKEDGKIKTIRVMCSCGRHAQLECEYSEESEEELYDV